MVELTTTLAGAQYDSVYRTQRCWLDPKRQYVALKTELCDCPAIDRDPQALPSQKNDITEYDEFRQSPRGIWYPTLARRKQAIYEGDENGAKRYSDQETRFYLDFSADLPDELFVPASVIFTGSD